MTACVRCGGRVKPLQREGRTTRYQAVAALIIPSDFPIPTCTSCRAEYLDPALSGRLARVLQPIYQSVLQSAAAALIEQICKSIPQRRLELILGLSQGYLSRLKARAGRPSSALVALLFLLAQPGAIAAVERYFAGMLLCHPQNRARIDRDGDRV